MGKWKQVQEYGKHIPHPLDVQKHSFAISKGILLLDATFLKIRGEERAILIAYDTVLGVVDYFIDETENKTSYSLMLARLQHHGYIFRCIVSDGHSSLESLMEEEHIPHQRCHFHIMQDLDFLLSIRGERIGKDQILYSRLKHILHARTLENLVQRLDFFRQHAFDLFPSVKHQKVIAWFWNILPKGMIFLSFESGEVPTTTSLLENLNGQIKARIKTMRGLKSEQSLENLLKIFFSFRNYK